MADRIIQTETLQSIANALRGGESQSAADKIEVADYAEVAQGLKADSNALKGVIDKSVSSITIPEGVTSIGKSAFQNCRSLTTVNLPSTLTLIDGSAFSGCTSLTSITIPEGVTSIGASAFGDCRSLTSITIPEGITSIGAAAFDSCRSLVEVNLPSTLTSIGSFAFNSINANAVINCGFAEGAVTGAPWEAPDTVTINYDVNN